MQRPIAYAGPVRTVVFAVCASGSALGLVFYCNELDESEQAKLQALFVRMGETGVIRDDRKFKHIEGTDLFEFKNFQIRMPCYYLPGGLLVITHGFRKQCDRIPPSEIARASRIRQEDTINFLNAKKTKKC
jgi:hypothetical protein